MLPGRRMMQICKNLGTGVKQQQLVVQERMEFIGSLSMVSVTALGSIQ